MARLSWLYILVPVLAMASVLPPILELPPVRWPRNVNVPQLLIVAPFWLGVAATPGYLYAWSGHHNAARLTTRGQLWVGGSLIASLFAGIAGSLVSIPAVIPVPFALGSSVCSFLLLRRFYRSRRDAV